jgi:hypothetical protein
LIFSIQFSSPGRLVRRGHPDKWTRGLLSASTVLHRTFRFSVLPGFLSKPARRTTWRKPVGESAPRWKRGDSLPHEGFWMTLAHGSSAQCPWGVSASISCGVDPQVSTAHFAGGNQALCTKAVAANTTVSSRCGGTAMECAN